MKQVCRYTPFLMLFMLSFGWDNGFAQSPPEVVHEKTDHAFGLNTFGFFDQFFGEENDTRTRSPYLLTYSAGFGRLAFRLGIGPEYSTETVVHDGFTNSEEQSFLRMDARAGAGIVVLDGGRWEALAGVDAIYSYVRDRNIDDSGFDRITNQIESNAYGGGPFIRIAFHVSPRISLATESSAYWTHRSSEHIELFKNFPDFNTILSETTSSGLELTLPNTIFLRIHF